MYSHPMRCLGFLAAAVLVSGAGAVLQADQVNDAQLPAINDAINDEVKIEQQQGGESPDEALKNMAEAVQQHDQEAFFATVKTTDEGKKLFQAVFGYTEASREFKEQMIEHYGEEGWQTFQEREGAKLEVPSPAETEVDLENVQIEKGPDGRTATARKPEAEEGISLVQEDGRWYVDLREQLKQQDEQKVKQAVELFQGLTEAVSETKDEIGREGVTPEELNDELAQRFMEVMLHQVMLQEAEEQDEPAEPEIELDPAEEPAPAGPEIE